MSDVKPLSKTSLILLGSFIFIIFAIFFAAAFQEPSAEKKAQLTQPKQAAYIPPRTREEAPQKASTSGSLQEVKLQRLAREVVSSHLKDPSSADFRFQKGSCGEVNAKNSFGALTGYKRFVAVSRDIVLIEGDGQFEEAVFEGVWAKVCN